MFGGKECLSCGLAQREACPNVWDAIREAPLPIESHIISAVEGADLQRRLQALQCIHPSVLNTMVPSSEIVIVGSVSTNTDDNYVTADETNLDSNAFICGKGSGL